MHVTKPSLDQLLTEAGVVAPKLRQILTETALNLLESRLIVHAETWHRVSKSDAFAKQFLTDLLGQPQSNDWDEEVLLGHSALGMLRAVNGRAHAYGATKGAARYKPAVAAAQGGTFCSMCGRREELVVDHIEPVTVGGTDDSLRNMQLLCIECNSGKSDLRDRALPIAVRHHITPTVSAGLRFKHLLIGSIRVDGRDRGVCECGLQADTTELRVAIWPSQAAANLLNLRTKCTNCD
jgi:5-methylcytosine-specific restriction endonuclease McrA